MIRQAYLRLLYRHGGIAAINQRLLRVDRCEEILGQFGAALGTETVIHGPLVIHNAAMDYRNLQIGDRVHVGCLTILDLAEPIVLAEDTVVSMGATILTHSDIGDRPLSRRYPRRAEPVHIGPAAYLGASVTVLPGCVIGREAVVGAGAVVTRSVPDGELAVGVPARVSRSASARAHPLQALGAEAEGGAVVE